MALDFNKPLQTKNGRVATVVGIRAATKPYTILVKIPFQGCGYKTLEYNREGEVVEGEYYGDYDLINIPEHTRFSLEDCVETFNREEIEISGSRISFNLAGTYRFIIVNNVLQSVEKLEESEKGGESSLNT